MIKLFLHRVVGSAVQHDKADSLCCCRHSRDAHTHYRGGTECAHCGQEVCSSFRKAHQSLSRLIPLYGVWRCGRGWTSGMLLA